MKKIEYISQNNFETYLYLSGKTLGLALDSAMTHKIGTPKTSIFSNLHYFFLLENEKRHQCTKECIVLIPYTKIMRGQIFLVDVFKLLAQWIHIDLGNLYIESIL